MSAGPDAAAARFTERLAEMMLRMNIGAPALSKLTGIPPRTVNHWLDGDRIPPLGSPYRAALAKALGVSLNWLNGMDVERDEEAPNAGPGARE
jgi:hypothetical protein